MKLALTALLIFACAGQARPLETTDERDSSREPPEGPVWAYLSIPDDRDFDAMAPITGGSHDPEEMPAGEGQDPPPSSVAPKAASEENVRIKKCGADGDCKEPRVCLRPPAGPHPYGICGEAVDHLGRKTSERTVRGCGPHLACPRGARCALAYDGYGVCLR